MLDMLDILDRRMMNYWDWDTEADTPSQCSPTNISGIDHRHHQHIVWSPDKY